VDFALTPEHELIRETAREFVEAEIVPHARDWDRAEAMDEGIVAKLAEIGFLGAGLPEEHGGMGLDTVGYCLVMEELGRADSSVRGVVSVNVGLVGKTIAKWGTDVQKREWLPRLASGDALGCYALTEPGSGSDPAGLVSRAERDGDDWILSGSKIFITLGTWAKVALVFARTGAEGARGITCFLVPTDSPGFSARPIKGKLGLRAQDTGELFLEGVRVPDASRLGAEGDGFKVAMSALDNGRISLAAGCVGIGRGCLEACTTYAKERRQFGEQISRVEAVSHRIVDMKLRLETARLLLYRLAWLLDQGRPAALDSALVKLHLSESFVESSMDALQVHGGAGYLVDTGIESQVRDAIASRIYSGTSDIQRNLAARHMGL